MAKTDRKFRHATFQLANGKTKKLHVKDSVLLPFETENSEIAEILLINRLN